MSEDLPRDDVLATIDRMVQELLDGAGVQAPPVDAIALAQGHLGIAVCLDRRQPQRGGPSVPPAGRKSFLKPEPTEERHQWTVAHEVGEHLKADLLRRLGIEPERTRAMAGESLANLFAHHLLVPSCWFTSDAAGLDYDLLELKKMLSTASHEMICSVSWTCRSRASSR